MNGQPSERAAGDGIKAAVYAFMREQPGKVLKARTIHDGMMQRGTLESTSKNTFHLVQSTLGRLARSGDIERVRYGQYRYLPGGNGGNPVLSTGGGDGG